MMANLTHSPPIVIGAVVLMATLSVGTGCFLFMRSAKKRDAQLQDVLRRVVARARTLTADSANRGVARLRPKLRFEWVESMHTCPREVRTLGNLPSAKGRKRVGESVFSSPHMVALMLRLLLSIHPSRCRTGLMWKTYRHADVGNFAVSGF